MLTCIVCSKQLGETVHPPDEDSGGTPNTRHTIKALKSQIKDMALKASGAYKHCKPCSGAESYSGTEYVDSDEFSASGRFPYTYRRTASWISMPRTLGKELKGPSSGERTPSWSGRTDPGSAMVLGEDEAAEWVAQVEPGVLITFVSLLEGGNDLKRIRFSREMFNKWKAQRWWSDNYEKVMELYNVRRFNHQAVTLPTPPTSDGEESSSPVTPPLMTERLPRNFRRRPTGMGYSSSDSLERLTQSAQSHARNLLAPTSWRMPSVMAVARTDTSSVEASVSTSSSRDADRSGELSVSISNVSEQETEWVEEDEPGVYITIRAMPGGIRELRRIRFSRERFGEMQARLWWEENRARIHEQYL